MSSSRSLKIGIVGFGSFGQFLAKTMIKQGHTLTATSRTDYTHSCLQLGIQFFRRPKTLFVDVLSVKEHPRDLLLRVLPEESDILCTHPMFGPESGKDGWKDLTFMYDKVRIRDEDTCSNLLHVFVSEDCRMLQMSCEEHDKIAAKSQFITHTVGRTLAEMNIESTPIDTKGFQTLIQLKDTTMRDSFDLYSGLFICNRFAHQELENLQHALHKVKETLIQRKSEELSPKQD
ncbi:arogenate dehydrogenase 1, chloroplastic-like isoform X2 [Vicia villosa]|uniref:arogenate dehydrogenase 1, chloroplastic-like isoform X2 n=1 Tax=Vicia villosa TaxID=3911 RepID=UPI00273C4C73|nr:arogenate dehydrogenase 1, chloroplastic-like isoform X2 [Vicia villosa]